MSDLGLQSINKTIIILLFFIYFIIKVVFTSISRNIVF